MGVSVDDINKRLFATEEESDELESSLDVASKRDPDTHVQNLSLASNHELPVETVSRNVDEVKRREMLSDMSIDTMRDAYPKTAQYLSDPDNASVSIDDVLGLKDFETALKDNNRGFWSNAAKGGLNRVNTLTGNLVEFAGNVSDDLTDYMVNVTGMPNPGIIVGDDGISWSWDIPTEMPDLITHVGKAVSEGEAYDYRPTFTWENLKGDVTPTNLAGYIAEQGVQSLPDMVAALFTLPAYVASRTEEIAEERVANDKRDDVTVGDLATSVVPATAVALVERLGAKVTFGAGKAVGVKGVAKAATGAAFVEGGTEFIQEGIEHLGETLGTENPVTFIEMLDRQFAGLVAGAGMGGTIRGSTATVEAIGNKSVKQMRIDAMSEADQTTLDDIITYSQSLETPKRSPEHFEKFVELIGADRSVLIPEEHFQGIEGLPSYILEQIDGTGTDVSIPLAKFASEIAPNEELMTAIRPHIRLSDSTLSQAELETGDRSQVEQMITNAQDYQETLTEADRVYETVKEQLVATGMQSDVTARYSAQLYPAAATVYVEKARKLGHDITVEEAFNAMGFQVRAERVVPKTTIERTEPDNQVTLPAGENYTSMDGSGVVTDTETDENGNITRRVILIEPKEDLGRNEFNTDEEFERYKAFRAEVAAEIENGKKILVELRKKHYAATDVIYDQDIDITMDVEDVATGEIIQETFNAGELLVETDSKIDAYKQLVDCLS